MLYRINPPETTPEYDEWVDAQDEKLQLMKKADNLIESFPFAGISNIDEMDSIIQELSTAIPILKVIRDELTRLEDDFPSGHEPDGDCDCPDSVWEGDR